MVQLPITGPYTRKDQLKADQANKFIGRGSPRSSTNAYRIAYGDKANCDVYTEDDIVFISAEGNRKGRLDPPWELIDAAAKEWVTFLTDKPEDRERAYNIGERKVAEYLKQLDYIEIAPGVWNLWE